MQRKMIGSLAKDTKETDFCNQFLSGVRLLKQSKKTSDELVLKEFISLVISQTHVCNDLETVSSL